MENLGDYFVPKARTLPCEPTGVVLTPDGKQLIVTCAAPRSTVAVIDTAAANVTATIPAGHTAMGPAISPDGCSVRRN